MSNKELAERLREAHDLSLDDHHREARVSILEVAAALEQQDAALAAQPVAPEQTEAPKLRCKSPASKVELQAAADAVLPRMWATEAEFFCEGFRAAETFHGVDTPTTATPAAVQTKAPSDLGSYGHRCPAVTGHRGPAFICQGSGERVSQESYCEKCTCPAAIASRAAATVRVACISLDGVTLTLPADTLTDLGVEDDAELAESGNYTLTFKTMTRAEYEALGEFDGF